MRTDGETGMTKLIVAFRKFANAPKKNVPVKINLHIFRADGHVTVYHNTMQCPHYREFTFVVKWFVYNLHKQVAVVLCPFETERCIVL